MADRVYHELLAVPTLEQLTALQLSDLAWKTREQVFIALFQEHASSSEVAEQLRSRSRDRRLERKTEKVENAERELIRKQEERFRSEFMQIVATEMARLGAPSMVTWQKLVFDKDCCVQAFRILLTKIKSSRRSSSSSSVAALRRSVASASTFTGQIDQLDPAVNDEGDQEQTSPTSSSSDRVLPSLPQRTQALARATRRVSKADMPEWNSDTSTKEGDTVASVSTPREREVMTMGEADTGITIQRTKRSMQDKSAVAALASKVKKNQMETLQVDIAALTSENMKLRDEIAHLEELVTTLQDESSSNQSRQDDPLGQELRIRHLQAQNVQLLRQLRLMQDAMQDREYAESTLLTALGHWREVVEAGRQEALSAGAATQAEKGGKPVQWMFAVPEKLLDELSRVEQQIYHAKKSMSTAYEAKLRVGSATASFLRDNNASSIRFTDVFQPGYGHLRLDRVKKLEASLAHTASRLFSIHEQLLNSFPAQVNGSSASPTQSPGISDALASIRSLTLEMGALGVVVPTLKTRAREVGQHPQQMTVAQVLKMLLATANGGLTGKERDKTLKSMLKQLQASEHAVETAKDMYQREAEYWKNAWQMQEQLLLTLMHRVRTVGDKKMQWRHSKKLDSTRTRIYHF
ncbi:hypothetical protein Poli38472_007717 [Pythium oligandrum]|uniref:Uncharacterized protein n=1 Tax=Pythium oligandrum TaxID=41045 RepID=A0A8K1CSR6_PYTOL|nr:hypothetical protein Poli38472_007717 [Pythium oligandrum]|eukprot:TMW68045.1 hypothetical protein Poli38472_007717 [Pythium oligandrum]